MGDVRRLQAPEDGVICDPKTRNGDSGINQQIHNGLVVRALTHVSQRRTSFGGAIAVPVENSGHPRVFGGGKMPAVSVDDESETTQNIAFNRSTLTTTKTFTWFAPSLRRR